MGIDPIIFSLDIGFTQLTIRWYGLLVVLGMVTAASYAAWYVKRKDHDPNVVWDALLWLLIGGIIGARIWYTVADMIGGHSRYLENPISILYISEGGLNILGGVVAAAVVGWYYCKRYQVDYWLLADAIGPGYLIGQAIGRLGNYINQELYGPPTTLPWGLHIEAAHRLAPWTDLTLFPVETTLFHPTFAYEMIWNLVFAAILTYLIINKTTLLKSGLVAGLSLMIAGVGRAILELYFRPDQPHFFGLAVSTSFIISVLFTLTGLFLVLVRSGKLSVPFMAPGTTEYAKKIKRRAPLPGPVRRKA